MVDDCIKKHPSKQTDAKTKTKKNGGGGCDAACQRALDALVTNLAKKGGVDSRLAVEVRKYILALGGNTQPCGSGGEMYSGEVAACNEMEHKSLQMPWQQLLAKWMIGGGLRAYFDGGSQLTWQLAQQSNTLEIISNLVSALRSDGGSALSLGGAHDHQDPTKASQAAKDLTAMATNGAAGGTVPDAFFGSYNEVYQVINQDSSRRVVTVAFGAWNDTGVQSLTHHFSDHSSGPGASVYEEFYWYETVAY